MATPTSRRYDLTSSKKILVAGGSGFIGSTVVSALWKAERPVGVLSRNLAEARARLHNIEVDYVRADLYEPRTLPKALKGVDTVISCAELTGLADRDSRAAQGIHNLVESAHAVGVRHIIHVSSAGVRAGHPDLAHERWYREKLHAERMIVESGVPYTIFRPSWLFGRDDQNLNKLLKLSSTLPFAPVIGHGSNRIQPLFIMDFVKALVAAIDRPETRDQIYEIGGPETLTMDDVLKLALEIRGTPKRLAHCPKWIVRAVSVPVGYARGRPVSPAVVSRLTSDELIDNTRVLRDLDLRLTPLRKALATYLSPEVGS